MQVVDALHHAGSDKRIQGVVGCVGDAQKYDGLAQVQELRTAILGFRYQPTQSEMKHYDLQTSGLLNLVLMGAYDRCPAHT